MGQVNYRKLVIGDTETTGFKENRIVSLAILVYENGKKIADKYILVNPKTKIEDSASKVNGITYDTIKDCPTFDKVWEEIKGYMTDSIWIFHNAKYDANKVIYPELQRYGLEIPNHLLCCTLENAKSLIPKSEVLNYKLGTLLEYFGYKLENAHSADADTWGCMKLYNQLVKLSDGNLIVK